MKRIVLALLVVVLLSSCSQNNQALVDVSVKATLTALAPTVTPEVSPVPTLTCAELTASWQIIINPVLREWDDALALALQTPRASLATPISNLQRIRRDTEDVQAPECATNARAYLTVYMDEEIKMLLAFSSNSTDGSVDAAKNRANVSREAYTAELIKLASEPVAPTIQASSTVTPTVVVVVCYKVNIIRWKDTMIPIIQDFGALFGSMGKDLTKENVIAGLANVKLYQERVVGVETPECLLVAQEHFITALSLSRQGLELYLNGDLDDCNKLLGQSTLELKTASDEVTRVTAEKFP